MAKLTELQKQIREAARIEWNEQCKAFMVYSRPFKDKTAKDCYNRVAKYYIHTEEASK
jgi:hypothetical protein